MQDLAHQFLAFCRSKPADEAYNQLNPSLCALGQFGKKVTADSAEQHGVPLSVYHLAAIDEPATFGALADRLATALERQ